MRMVFTRWLGKDGKVADCIIDWPLDLLINLDRHKGKKSDWLDEEWPPVKVTITVETAE